MCIVRVLIWTDWIMWSHWIKRWKMMRSRCIVSCIRHLSGQQMTELWWEKSEISARRWSNWKFLQNQICCLLSNTYKVDLITYSIRYCIRKNTTNLILQELLVMWKTMAWGHETTMNTRWEKRSSPLLIF